MAGAEIIEHEAGADGLQRHRGGQRVGLVAQRRLFGKLDPDRPFWQGVAGGQRVDQRRDGALGEFARGEVHVHEQVVALGLAAQVRQGLGGPDQHVGGERLVFPAARRRGEARAGPAGQRLEADDAAIAQRDDRLVDGHEVRAGLQVDRVEFREVLAREQHAARFGLADEGADEVDVMAVGQAQRAADRSVARREYAAQTAPAQAFQHLFKRVDGPDAAQFGQCRARRRLDFESARLGAPVPAALSLDGFCKCHEVDT